MTTTNQRWLIGLLAPLLLTSGCATGQLSPHPTTAATTKPATVTGSDLTLVEMTSPQDWATFADHVVVVRVIGEVRLQPTKEEIAAQEGVIPRRISVQVIKDVWAPPGIKQRAVPDELSWLQGAWLFSEDHPERRLIGESEGAWGEIGHEYVAALAYSGFGPTESAEKDKRWGSLTMIPADDEVLGSGEKVPLPSSAGSLRGSVAGKRVDALADLLNQAQPHEAAKKVMGEDLSVRAAAVNG